MMTTMIRGELQRTLTLCVDSYEVGIIKGRVYSVAHADGQSFVGLMALLQLIEQDLDEMNYPQSFAEIRHFFSQKLCTADTAADILTKKGNNATFSIRILFRQNASWQGSVSWVEGGTSESFRSALELIFLIGSALSDHS